MQRYLTKLMIPGCLCLPVAPAALADEHLSGHLVCEDHEGFNDNLALPELKALLGLGGTIRVGASRTRLDVDQVLELRQAGGGAVAICVDGPRFSTEDLQRLAAADVTLFMYRSTVEAALAIAAAAPDETKLIYAFGDLPGDDAAVERIIRAGMEAWVDESRLHQITAEGLQRVLQDVPAARLTLQNAGSTFGAESLVQLANAGIRLAPRTSRSRLMASEWTQVVARAPAAGKIDLVVDDQRFDADTLAAFVRSGIKVVLSSRAAGLSPDQLRQVFHGSPAAGRKSFFLANDPALQPALLAELARLGTKVFLDASGLGYPAASIQSVIDDGGPRAKVVVLVTDNRFSLDELRPFQASGAVVAAMQ